MREVLNISLPKTMANNVKKEVKSGNFASTSEFIRHLIRLYNAKKLAIELRNDRKKFEAGEGIELKSLEDLM